MEFSDKPHIYNEFLEIMKNFKALTLATLAAATAFIPTTAQARNVDDAHMELARANPDEKQACLERTQAISRDEEALASLQKVAREGGNVFEELMETTKVASLGQITDALFAVGGQYRRNM